MKQKKIFKNFRSYRYYKVLKLSFFILILILYSILLIVCFSESEEEKYDSPIFDGTYACHDSISCGIKYGKSACNISTDSQFKEVFMSALYTENYFKGSLLLGYTIKKYHPNHAMYLLYFPSQISASLVCQLKAVGWIMKEVERIPVPWDGHLYGNFDDQFTKLQMWSLIEFDSIIYIDSDAIVLQRIDNLFKMITPYAKFEFAAAPDVLDWQILTKFNAGFIILKPDINVYKEMMRVHKVRDSFDLEFAEQSFLNEFYKFRYYI
ncbi:glycosyltransferase family 8 protein [Gigaspora margarita]|uniref:Glycosyltransferase family 8 protein n=1 Tax=Gigaspora margarita TaxID=4874 RepID=A0A8H4AJD9_GIGMA|nr:glycosyltransferase family 8 protein [Gigaspora margarita]